MEDVESPIIACKKRRRCNWIDSESETEARYPTSSTEQEGPQPSQVCTTTSERQLHALSPIGIPASMNSLGVAESVMPHRSSTHCKHVRDWLHFFIIQGT